MTEKGEKKSGAGKRLKTLSKGENVRKKKELNLGSESIVAIQGAKVEGKI